MITCVEEKYYNDDLKDKDSFYPSRDHSGTVYHSESNEIKNSKVDKLEEDIIFKTGCNEADISSSGCNRGINDIEENEIVNNGQ